MSPFLTGFTDELTKLGAMGQLTTATRGLNTFLDNPNNKKAGEISPTTLAQSSRAAVSPLTTPSNLTSTMPRSEMGERFS